MNWIVRNILLVASLQVGTATAYVCDLIVFSYDRPLQLYALLESVETYITDLETVHVIYRASSPAFEQAYDEVLRTFSHVYAYKQGSKPRMDFKYLTLKALGASKNDYIMFAVDDMIVTDFVPLKECCSALEASQAYAFYLRLGDNITLHYQSGRQYNPPQCRVVGSGIQEWIFGYGSGAWRYPNTVDMAIYRKKDVVPLLRSMRFHNPNELEGVWAESPQALATLYQKGLCFIHSKVVNLPLNCVQKIFDNKHMASFSTEQLLAVFNAGLKIDIMPLFKIDNESAHMEYEPQFAVRD